MKTQTATTAKAKARAVIATAATTSKGSKMSTAQPGKFPKPTAKPPVKPKGAKMATKIEKDDTKPALKPAAKKAAPKEDKPIPKYVLQREKRQRFSFGTVWCNAVLNGTAKDKAKLVAHGIKLEVASAKELQAMDLETLISRVQGGIKAEQKAEEKAAAKEGKAGNGGTSKHH